MSKQRAIFRTMSLKKSIMSIKDALQNKGLIVSEIEIKKDIPFKKLVVEKARIKNTDDIFIKVAKLIFTGFVICKIMS